MLKKRDKGEKCFPTCHHFGKLSAGSERSEGALMTLRFFASLRMTSDGEFLKRENLLAMRMMDVIK